MTMEDGLITPQKWRDCWRWYRAEQHQQEGVNRLYEHIKAVDPALLHESAEWLSVFRSGPDEEDSRDYPNTWDGVMAAAKAYGAKFPQVVAAQWALESGYGKHAPGHNYFGIKGQGTLRKTQEVYGGQQVAVVDSFIDFPSLKACVQYLVERWYLDFKGYKGVNRASTAQECARLLKAEGYGTDPAYAEKLITLMRDHA